jgi:hypothetical protein
MVEKVAGEKSILFDLGVWFLYTYIHQHPGRTERQATLQRIVFLHNRSSRLSRSVSIIQAYSGVNIPTKRIPLAMKIGRRPLISENGASTIGARAKPQQKSVILKL